MDRSASAVRSPRIMKPSTIEDCLEALHALEAAHRAVPVPVVARWLGVRPELGAAMLEVITAQALAEGATPLGIRLTARGREEAARVVRRRRLLESVLIADHGYPLGAGQVIAARIGYAVPDHMVNRAAGRFGEPDLTPRAEPAPAWAVAMRAQLAQTEHEPMETTFLTQPTTRWWDDSTGRWSAYPPVC